MLFWTGNGQVDRAYTDPSGRTVAVIGAEHVLGLWTTTGTPQPVENVPLSDASTIAIGTGGLIAAADDARFRVWDLASGALRTEATTPSAVTAMGFSPDCRRLATGTQDGTVQVWAIAAPDPNTALKLEALRLTREEHEMITAAGPLISTPRTARRLVNTYRLLRTTLEETERARVGSGGHRVLILLLAVLVGFPSQGAEVLEDLLRQPTQPDDFTALLAGKQIPPAAPGDDVRVWGRLEAAVRAVARDTGTTDDIDEYRHWAPHVARFSFRTGHLI